ncbi:MAG: GNAT family N-acetyltransferase [Treponema sp.]|jgi:ribosomal protein S18 acetylase RimI-like enzyme|nr:GNAT family N-acetyltransferase [Treponema sp.]
MDILNEKNLLIDGKIQRWPKKTAEKEAVLGFIASKVPPEGKLAEKEINRIIMQNILFDDFTLIRRELIERGYLARTRDCREYWRTPGDAAASLYKIEKMNIENHEKIISLWKNTEGVGLSGNDDSKDAIKKFLDKNSDTCFIAKKDDEIIGTIMAGSDGRRGHIYHLMVKPEFRKNGIGRKLLEEAEKGLQKEGIKKAFLVVFKDNIIGNGFWEEIGYKTREDLYYRDKRLD